ncbi:MAG: ATP-binding protein [Paenibacillaceae bacterium]
MIKMVSWKNFKGTTSEQVLTGKDIFIGPNGSGKSTVLEAVGISMYGSMPGKGSQLSEAFKFGKGSEMVTGLDLDNFSFNRGINRISKLNEEGENESTYAANITLSPSNGESGLKQMQARVTSEVGNFPLIFDFDGFMKKTDADRRKDIFDLSPIVAEEWNKEAIKLKLESKLLLDNIKEVSPELYSETQTMISECLAVYRDSFKLSDGLKAMIDWAKLNQATWNKDKKDATGAVREIGKIKNDLEETDRDIVKTKGDLAKTRENHTDVHGQITAGIEIQKQWDKKQLRIAELKTEIESLVALLAIPNEIDFENQIEEINLKMKTTNISEQASTIQSGINAFRIQKDAKVFELDRLKLESDKLEQELQLYETTTKRILDKGATICVINDKIDCNKDFSPFIGYVNNNSPKIQLELNKIQENKSTIDAEIQSINAQTDLLESNKRELYASADVESKRNETLRKEIEQIRSNQRNAEQIKQNNITKKTALEDELNRLTGEKMPIFASLEILEPQLIDLANLITTLQKTVDDKEIAKTTLSNQKTASINATIAKNKHTALKNISAALGAKGIQGELVKTILSPIEGIVNSNLRAMGKIYPMYFSTESENGKEEFEFGWIKDGSKTNYDVLSKSEQVVFMSALYKAMLDRKNPPLKIFAADNIENLWIDTFKDFIEGLNAIQDSFDNIILCGAVQNIVSRSLFPDNLPDVILNKFIFIEDLEAAGWKVWDLTPATVE